MQEMNTVIDTGKQTRHITKQFTHTTRMWNLPLRWTTPMSKF